MAVRFESVGLVKDFMLRELLLSEATLDNVHAMLSFIMLICSFTADLVSIVRTYLHFLLDLVFFDSNLLEIRSWRIQRLTEE